MSTCDLRGELRSLTKLAVPIMFTQLAQMFIGFADTVMAGNASSLDLAGVSIGGGLWGAWLLFLSGTIMAVSPNVAQLRGANRIAEIGPFTRQSLWLALFLGILSFILVRNIRFIMEWISVDKQIIPIAIDYLRARSWGVLIVPSFLALRYFSEALARPKPIMLVLVLGTFCNITGNYLLIYGKFGFPAMGGVGCGWASAIANWIMFLALLALTRSTVYRETRLWQRWSWPHLATLQEILKLGFPIGFAWFIEASVFSFIALFISPLGADAVSAHQIALNFASLVFMIPLSISMATTVRVGHSIGENQLSRARLASYTGIGFAVFISLFTSLLIYLFPDKIAILYSKKTIVIALASHLLLFAAIFQISDAVQVSTLGALRGYKDTRIPMILTIISYWIIGMPLGYTLGMASFWGNPMGAQGFWIGLVAGLTVSALLLSLRLYLVSKQYLQTTG